MELFWEKAVFCRLRELKKMCFKRTRVWREGPWELCKGSASLLSTFLNLGVLEVFFFQVVVNLK